MTATTVASVSTRVRTGSVVLALTRFEAGRALRHPLNWVGAAGSLWVMWRTVGNTAPMLQRDTVYLAGAMLPLGATTLLVSFYATLRRRETPEVLASMPVGAPTIEGGLLLGALGTLPLAVALTGAGVVYVLAGDPIGTMMWWELAAGPALVPALGMVGVALGRFLPHPIVGPVALAALGFVQMNAAPNIATFDGNFLRTEWMAPWMPPDPFMPVELWASRPSAAHLHFLAWGSLLLALVVLLAARGRRVLGVTLAAAGLSSALAISALIPPASGYDFVSWFDSQPCAERGETTFCYASAYREWVPRWEQVVQRVSRLAPVAVDWVVQRSPFLATSEDWAEQIPSGVVRVGWEWDRPGSTPSHAFALALEAAETGLGLPTTPFGDGIPEECWAGGQGRGAVAIWLAAASVDGGSRALFRAIDTYSPGSFAFQPLPQPRAQGTALAVEDARLALALSEFAFERVDQVIRARWDQVRSPATTSTELAAWFDLTATLPGPPPFDLAPCP